MSDNRNKRVCSVFFDGKNTKSTREKVISIVSGTWTNYHLTDFDGGVLVHMPSNRDAVSAKRALNDSGFFLSVSLLAPKIQE